MRGRPELCEALTAEDEKAFEALFKRLGLSVDWQHTYETIGERARRAAQRAFLRNLARGEALVLGSCVQIGRKLGQVAGIRPRQPQVELWSLG